MKEVTLFVYMCLLLRRNIGHRHVWERRILPDMQKAIINSMLCSQDTIDARKVRWEIASLSLSLRVCVLKDYSQLKAKEADEERGQAKGCGEGRGLIIGLFCGHSLCEHEVEGRGRGVQEKCEEVLGWGESQTQTLITLSSKVKSRVSSSLSL